MATKICSACGEDDVKEGYSYRQWARTNSKCSDCIHGLAGAPPNDNGVEPTRECRECHEVQPKSAYSNTQWKKGEKRRCKTCVDDSLAADAVKDVTDFMGKTLTLKTGTLPPSPIPVNVTGGAHHPFKVTGKNDEESVAESVAESDVESVAGSAEAAEDAGVESVAESANDAEVLENDDALEESDVESANNAEALEESAVESAESSEESDVESEESVVESAESSEESGMESANSPSDSDSSFVNSSGESDSDAEGRTAKRPRQRYALRASDASNIAPMPPRARRSNAKRARGS